MIYISFLKYKRLMKKYDMIVRSKPIYNSSNSGPNFGNSDFSLSKDMKIGKSFATQKSAFLSNNNLELTGGTGEFENFETEELEVYKVIYN